MLSCTPLSGLQLTQLAPLMTPMRAGVPCKMNSCHQFAWSPSYHTPVNHPSSHTGHTRNPYCE